MEKGVLGKIYSDREVIVRQSEKGECMYIVQKGSVEVIHEKGGQEIRVAVLDKGDVFGEMALFEQEPRSATVRALGEALILTIDKKTFFRRVHEDPSLAFNILQKMSYRIRQLNKILGKERSSG